MILKNRIKKIIDAIKDSDINEIEISSFSSPFLYPL